METAEIDKELEELDTRIDQLRALYEQYFMGIERLEPQKPRQEVERRIKVLRKEQIRNTAQRFKFNVLVQRMTTMQQYWGRVLREMEAGTFKRDVIRAAARFGDHALTGVSKRRAKELAKLAAVQATRRVDDTMELDDDDLVEDDGWEVAEADETPTPPKLGEGLHPGDLPVVGLPAPPSSSVASIPVVAAPNQAAPPAQTSGLRPVSPASPSSGFGSLDLDFDDSPRPAAVAPQPVAAPVTRSAAPRSAQPKASPAPAAAAASSRGFGVLDVPFGAGLRSASAPQQAAPPAAGAGGLSDQRIRQIYAKYVETKRASNESTAGVTYDKLASSLRAQAEKLKASYPSKSIDYEVVVKEGKTHLKPVLR